MKKRALAILVLVCVCCALAFAACNTDLPHTSHKWSTTYTQDGDIHYQTCSGCDEKNSAKHNYDADGVCICGKIKPEAVIAVTKVSLDNDTLTLEIGDTETLTATVTPDNATDTKLTWKSDKTDIVTVTNDGNVTAVSAGTATVTATASNGQSASCAVTVNAAITDALAGKTFVCYDVKCRSDVYGEEDVKTTEDLTKEHNIGSTLEFNNDGTFLWTIESSKQSGTYELDGETITLTYTSPSGYKATALYIDGEITMEVNVMKIITCYYLRLQTA